jgi:hypothetical protein
MAALDLVDSPAKVYWTTVPRSGMQRFGTILREAGVEWEPPEPSAEQSGPPMGLPDDEVTTWVDVTAFGGPKFDALAAHASQSDNILFLRLGRDRFSELMGVETFVRVRDSTGTPVPENDLFAGLR